MRVAVKLRYQPHSVRKFQPLTRQFRGQNLERAMENVSVIPNQSARLLFKAFKMAKAAAVGKELDEKKLVIDEVFATTGPRLKRVRANARGRSNRYQKHLAHLTVAVSEGKNQGVTDGSKN